MATSNFKETILKLLKKTDYPMDLTENDISSFDNIPELQPILQWMTQNLSEANCVTPDELERFEKLQKQGRVKYGDDLEQALQEKFTKDGALSVPFKESLNDSEQELALLKEQLHYKQVLHQELCSSNVALDNNIQDLKEKKQKAELKNKEVIKKVLATNKKFKEKLNATLEDLNELRDDIIGLSKKVGSPDESTDEGVHSLTSDKISNQSLSASTWSISTSSSWQTIRRNDPNTCNYMSQLSFDKYQRIHNSFTKRLTKLLEKLSKKVEKSSSNSVEYADLQLAQESLEKQMLRLIKVEAELEGIRAARVKIKQLRETAQTEDALLSTLRQEEKEVEKRMEKGSLKFGLAKEELPTACKQWAEFKALQAIKVKLMERVEISKSLIEKMDELLKPLILKVKADNILSEILKYEKEKIEMSISLYKEFHSSLHNQFEKMKKRIDVMEENIFEFEQFCALPLEQRSDLVQQLCSIILCDNSDVVEAIQHLSESSRNRHKDMYERYVLKKNYLVTSGQHLEESLKGPTSDAETDHSQIIGNIQQCLDQMDSGIEEAANHLYETRHDCANRLKEAKKNH